MKDKYELRIMNVITDKLMVNPLPEDPAYDDEFIECLGEEIAAELFEAQEIIHVQMEGISCLEIKRIVVDILKKANSILRAGEVEKINRLSFYIMKKIADFAFSSRHRNLKDGLYFKKIIRGCVYVAGRPYMAPAGIRPHLMGKHYIFIRIDGDEVHLADKNSGDSICEIFEHVEKARVLV